jgi:hypothetical protein
VAKQFGIEAQDHIIVGKEEHASLQGIQAHLTVSLFDNVSVAHDRATEISASGVREYSCAETQLCLIFQGSR